MNQDWSFLRSNRFYGNLIISIGYWLQQPDAFTQAGVGQLLVVFGGLFVAIRTIDRLGEKLGGGQPPAVTGSPAQ